MTQIGSVIDGKYEILTEIGRGGMSVVYLAMDKRLNKQWAIKEVRKKGVSKNDEIVVNSLVAEANLIKRLDHPAFPRIVDIIDNGQTIYIVMDYIEGESLDKILEEHGAQSEDNVIHWAMQICDALNYLHAQKPHPIIYRDMKPANLMLKPEGEYGIIKIIDFGIAREYKDKNLPDTTVLGTRGYASPEHYAGHTDVRSDIFSLGMTMHHLLTGIDPRKGDQYASVRNWNPELSEGIEIIIDKCVQPAPENRYQNCDELLRDLYDPSKLTHDYRKKQKMKLAAFVVPLLLSGAMLLSGFALKGASDKINNDDYEKLIGVEAATEYGEKVAGYKRAIAIYPEDLRGYTKLLEAYADDSIFNEQESSEFFNLYNKYNDRFESDSPETCELRYAIGVLYFNYYESSDKKSSDRDKKQKAYKFFEKNYACETEYQHKRINDVLYSLCDFYNTYLLDSKKVDEPNKSDYETLMSTISSRMDDLREEMAYNQLSFYSVVFNLLWSERQNMAIHDVDQAQVLALFDEIWRNAELLKPNKEAAQAMQAEILDNYQSFRNMIESAYTTQERRNDNG